MAMTTTLLSPRSISPDSTKSRLFAPLSPHGMPKPPPRSNGPHRFSSIPPPVRIIPSSPSSLMTPMSPPMSPPLSARSFGTMIDSTPSTPSWSPQQRSGSEWDNSTIMLLSPVSTAPSSPPPLDEPVWDMMSPARTSSRTSSSKRRAWVPPASMTRPVTSGAPLSSHPVHHHYYHGKENFPPLRIEEPPPPPESVEEKTKKEEEEESNTITAPLEKLATRVKLMLKRKTTLSEKRKERRRRQYHELDRVETLHWTEM